ncbi:MAG: ferrous iron transport protein B [Acidobacteriota bacterium]
MALREPILEGDGRPEADRPSVSPTLFLVGSPNVGKSVLFGALTGSYAVVSNYPGTTVEVSRGTVNLEGRRCEVVDTPGMYSLRPITEEERVARDILLQSDGLIVHVVDAKNLPRMLPLTLELAWLGRPLVLVLNLMDEARQRGIRVDSARLSEALRVPVVEMVATRGEGLDALRRVVSHPPDPPAAPVVSFPKRVEAALAALEPYCGRFWALRHLEGDPAAAEAAPVPSAKVEEALRRLEGHTSRRSLEAQIAGGFSVAARTILEGSYRKEGPGNSVLQDRLDGLLLNPWTGFPVLCVVLYLGLYQFVGVFGGGTLVGFLEGTVFGEWINPFLERVFAALVPADWLRSLFVGEFGLFTLGLRYAAAIILPVVGTFFLAFSVLEDTGYLPRLAMMLDRVFKGIGLNGRAVIPLVLGFGCDTMATMVTRILETRRERVIATFLLALSIPCSAQIGVLLGLLSAHPRALLLWAVIVLSVFLAAGSLMARLLPGERPSFFMELPPLRWPSFTNVWTKTASRMGWYFLEIVPLFLVASLLIWLGTVTGFFPLLVGALEPVVGFIGLPPQAATAFLFGFFRRDYGAAGLYDLQSAGALTGAQLLVATVVLTLFLPCIAQFLVMRKERGWPATLAMSGTILAVAFSVGWILKIGLDLWGGVL